MDGPFAFWFPAIWTMLGALFTIFSFALSAYIVFVRNDVVPRRLGSICVTLDKLKESVDLRLTSLETLTGDVEALRMALVPHGEPGPEALRVGLRELVIELQVLAAAIRHTHGVDTESMTVSGALAIPRMQEISSELRQSRKGKLKIQKWFKPFSHSDFFEMARAEGLARERIQANPNPFHELD